MEKGRDSISRRSHHCQIPSLESGAVFSSVLLPASLPKQCLSSMGESPLAVSTNPQITFLPSLGRGRRHREGWESITPFSVTFSPHPFITQGQEPLWAEFAPHVICPTCQKILALICPLVDF